MPDGAQRANALCDLPGVGGDAACCLQNISFKGLTIGLNGVGRTPVEKCLWVDFDPDDQMSPGLPSALIALGLLAPSFIASGDVIIIDHDLAQSRVCLRIKPGNSTTIN